MRNRQRRPGVRAGGAGGAGTAFSITVIRPRGANQIYLLATLFAHNLTRELQMATAPPQRHTTQQRATLWIFEKLETLRRTVIQRAGRLTRPKGKLTLTISGGEGVKSRLLRILGRLQAAA